MYGDQYQHHLTPSDAAGPRPETWEERMEREDEARDQRLFTFDEWSGYKETMKVVPKQPMRKVSKPPTALKPKTEQEETFIVTKPAKGSTPTQRKSSATTQPKKKKKTKFTPFQPQPDQQPPANQPRDLAKLLLEDEQLNLHFAERERTPFRTPISHSDWADISAAASHGNAEKLRELLRVKVCRYYTLSFSDHSAAVERRNTLLDTIRVLHLAYGLVPEPRLSGPRVGPCYWFSGDCSFSLSGLAYQAVRDLFLNVFQVIENALNQNFDDTALTILAEIYKARGPSLDFDLFLRYILNKGHYISQTILRAFFDEIIVRNDLARLEMFLNHDTHIHGQNDLWIEKGYVLSLVHKLARASRPVLLRRIIKLYDIVHPGDGYAFSHSWRFEFCHVDRAVRAHGDSGEQRTHMAPLHFAAEEDDLPTVRCLLELGANPTVIDIWGKRPDEYAGPNTRSLLLQAHEDYIRKYTRFNPWGGFEESVDIRTKAITRLMRDIKAIYLNPLPNIRALPLDTDIFEWHVVMSPPPRPSAEERDYFPYTGIRFHMILQFPHDYPRSPPNLVISHWIKHPNVYGVPRWSKLGKFWESGPYHVCLDMLTATFYSYDWETDTVTKMHDRGWTTSYTAESILVQLQSFFFDENVPQMVWGRDDEERVVANEVTAMERKAMVRNAEWFKCRECGFGLSFPAVNYKSVNDLMLGSVEKRSEEEVRMDKDPREMKSRELRWWLLEFGLLKNQIPSDDNECRALLAELDHKQAMRREVVGTESKKIRAKTGKHRDKTEAELNDTTNIRTNNYLTGVTLTSTPVAPHNEAVSNEVRRLVAAGQTAAARQLRALPVEQGTGPCLAIELPQYLIMEIFDYLKRIEDVSALMRAHSVFRIVAERFSIWTRRELNCFFTRASFHEEILGIGIAVERHGKSDRIKTLNSPLDLISRSAFLEDEIRNSAYRQPFDYWLPLPLTESHAKYSIPLAKSMLVGIFENVSFKPPKRHTELERKSGPSTRELVEFDEKMTELRERFDPLMVLDILPKLMNHMVVSLMKEDSEGNLALHASEKALLGYCSYHHLMLNLVQEFPDLKAKINSIIAEFLRHESCRVKLVTPDLGELLVLLAFTNDYSWPDIATPFLQEFYDRLVFWMVDERHSNHPELAFLEKDPVSHYRLNTTLAITKTSTRLLMFQVFFLQRVARRDGHPLSRILDEYNRSYGRPPVGTAELLCEETRRIHNVTSWQEFYERIGLLLPSDEAMTRVLRQAFINSELKYYHIPQHNQAHYLELRSQRDLLLMDGRDIVLPRPGEVVPQALIQEVELRQTEKPEVVFTEPVTLFCRNLSYRLTEQEFADSFRQFGKVQAKLPLDEQGRPRGIGFVTLPNRQLAETVLKHIHGLHLLGREIDIRLAEPRGPRRARLADLEPQPSDANDWQTARKAQQGHRAPAGGRPADRGNQQRPHPSPPTAGKQAPAPASAPAAGPRPASKPKAAKKPSSNPFALLEEQ